ncbi:hypothetical protein QF046_001214 [Microbacterium sp. W4I4]|nr:hypothetical protein [Microbacterium sp. W4I4]
MPLRRRNGGNECDLGGVGRADGGNECDLGGGAHDSRSTIIAVPWPTPTHMVASP